MTAPEVPVEELIGWEWSRTTRLWGTPSGGKRRAEVDDLADWLVKREVQLQIECVFAEWHVGGGRYVNRNSPEWDWWDLSVLGPTIRAALEAAVRAVHEQENR